MYSIPRTAQLTSFAVSCKRKKTGRGRWEKFAINLAAAVFLLSFVWAAPSPQASYGEQRVEENELKAVYLYNFLQFVQWPEPGRVVQPGEELVIGIVGEAPVSAALDRMEETIRDGGMRPVRVVHYGAYREGMSLRGCNLLFLAETEKPHFKKIIESLGDAPVLTVSDTESLLNSGGMITLVQRQGKLRWMINRAPADRAGLRFNAQMLRLAVKVVE